MQPSQKLGLSEWIIHHGIIEFCEPPLILSNGWYSPVYFEGRRIPGIVPLRTYVTDIHAAKVLDIMRREEGQESIIAGVATGGISISAIVADRLRLPHCYVRTTRDCGVKHLIEHLSVSGRDVIVMEDVTTTGGSSGDVVRILNEAGGHVRYVLSHLTYGFAQCSDIFAALGVTHMPLVTFPQLLDAMAASDRFSAEQCRTIADWYGDPAAWTLKMKQVFQQS